MQSYSMQRPVLAACLVVLLATIAAIDSSFPRSGSAAADDETPRQLSPGDIDTELSRVYVFVGKKRLGHEHGMEGLVREGEIHVGSSDHPGEIVFDMTA